MSYSDIRHLHIEVSEDLYNRLLVKLPWGTKKRVIERVLWQLARALEGEHGEYVLGALLSDQFDVTETFKPNSDGVDARTT